MNNNKTTSQYFDDISNFYSIVDNGYILDGDAVFKVNLAVIRLTERGFNLKQVSNDIAKYKNKIESELKTV